MFLVLSTRKATMTRIHQCRLAIWRNSISRVGPALTASVLLALVAASGVSGQEVAKISANMQHGVAVLPDGRVMTWGENDRGQLGRGNTDSVNVEFPPAVVPGIDGAADAAAGLDFTLVRMADGTVMSWGEAEAGQLGLGKPGVRPRPGTPMEKVWTPTRIPGLKGVRQVAAGQLFGLALLEDGTVMAWGSSTAGVLGDGKGTAIGMREYRVPYPQRIEGLTGVKSIGAGNNIAFAVMEDGTVRGWGSNEHWQIGVEEKPWVATPTLIAGLSGVRSVHGGLFSAMALLEDGTVRVWGGNSGGIFGDGSAESKRVTVPQPVPGVNGVVQLSVIYDHAVALLKDGTVRSWGGNRFGELGGAHSESVKSVVTPRLKGVVGIAAGGARSYFLMPEGQLLMAGFVKANVVNKAPAPFAVLR